MNNWPSLKCSLEGGKGLVLSIPTNIFVEKVVWGITRLRKDSATIVLGLLRPVSDCWMAISWLIISLSIRTCHRIGSGGQGGGL